MLNITLMPGTSPVDTLGAYAILAVIADPVATKDRLDQLVAEKQAALDALNSARALNEQNRQLADAAARDADAARALTASQATERATLDQRAAALEAHEDQIATMSAALEKAAADNDAATKKQADDLAAREEAVSQREKAAADLLAQAGALKADYEQKSQALKALVT